MAAAPLLLIHAALWDGTGAPIQEDTQILLVDGRIAAIADDLSAQAEAAGARTLDLTGLTVLPGLIDAHVHLSMDPGAAWRQDSPAEHREALSAHLRAYLACGVTTVLDPAVLPDDLALIRATLDAGAPGPRYLPLGTPFSPPGGYVASVIDGFPSVATPADVEAQLNEAAGQALSGIKVTMEDGFYAPIWPMHSDAILEAIQTGAAARDLPVYVHAISPDEQQRALDTLSPRAMVHPLDRPDRRTISALAAAGVYEITTLATAGMMRIAGQPLWMESPLIALTVPLREQMTAFNPRTAAAFNEAMIRNTFPHLPFKAAIARSGLPLRQAEARLRHTAAALHAMDDAGIPLVMGSDAGNWPVIPYLFHGPSSLFELSLIREAGFSAEESLLMATRNAAQMLGMDGEIGTVQPGRAADLVVVSGLEGMDVRWTIRAGEARTPEGWMGRQE